MYLQLTLNYNNIHIKINTKNQLQYGKLHLFIYQFDVEFAALNTYTVLLYYDFSSILLLLFSEHVMVIVVVALIFFLNSIQI